MGLYIYLRKLRKKKELRASELNKQKITVDKPSGNIRLNSFFDIFDCGLGDSDTFVQYAITNVVTGGGVDIESEPIYSDFYKIATKDYSDGVLNNERFGIFFKIESQQRPLTFNVYRRYTQINYDLNPDKRSFKKIQTNISNVSATDSHVFIYDIPDTKDIPDFCII